MKVHIIHGMNKSPLAKRVQILSMLCEGSSMRSVSRAADDSINTASKLLVEAGEACSDYQDRTLINLKSKRVQVDEIWSFCYSKAKNVPEDKKGQLGFGDLWTWTAIDADTKLVPSWYVGGRDAQHAHAFIGDLSRRLANRVQLTSDGHKAYLDVIHDHMHQDVDYAMLGKIYGVAPGQDSAHRYSPAACLGAKKRPILGNPDPDHISTSCAERQNLTMRMQMRRITRLTNAFSKKAQNHVHALSLYFMSYNFVRIHKTLRSSDGSWRRGPSVVLGRGCRNDRRRPRQTGKTWPVQKAQ